MSTSDILIADTVTKLGTSAFGRVLIAGSHGGIYAGWEAARAGARAVILHDAGVGLEQAGIGALGWLQDLNIAAATVDYQTAVIGNGNSMANGGTISFVNDVASSLGCQQGQSTLECANRMIAAPLCSADIPQLEEARFIIRARDNEPVIWGCDSVSLVKSGEEGAIVITASHGELLAGSPSWGSRPDVLAAVFNDAGSSTATRLPDLDTRGISGATVAAGSARIGDARSTWENGIITHVNQHAAIAGAKTGTSTMEFADLMIAQVR